MTRGKSAIKRGDMLEQNRIRFRDLEQSREKWRNEALSLRQTMVWQEKNLREIKRTYCRKGGVA